MKKKIVKSELALTSILRAAAICICTVVLVYGQEEQDAEEQTDNSLGQYYGFGPMEILKLEPELSPPIVVDINKDRLNDLVVINNRKARIELLLQKRDFSLEEDIGLEINDEDINDVWGRESSWRFKRMSYSLDVAAYSLVVADLNNDSYPDLAYYAQDGLRVALQEAVAGQEAGAKTHPVQPNFSEARKFDIREGLASYRALAAGDINGDGRNDLVLLANDGVFILRQDGEGGLSAPVKYHSASDKLKQLDIADVNNDKRAELILGTALYEEYPLRIFWQSAEGELGPERQYHLSVPSVLETASFGPSLPGHLVSVVQQSGRVEVLAFSGQAHQQSYPVSTYPLGATEKAEDRDMVSADVDGDGLWDVIVSDPARAEFILYRADAENSLTTGQHFPGLKSMVKLSAGDLDKSGRDTIAVLSFEEKIIGLSRFQNGRLSYPESVVIQGEPQAIDLADINGDGLLDLVYITKEKQEPSEGAKSSGYGLRTVLSLGRAEAQPGPQVELTEIKDKPLDVRVADIDHDGRGDVMIIRSYEPILLLRQSAPGEFETQLSQNINSGLVARVSPEAFSLAELGPEGRTAALLVQKNFARALVFDPDKGWQVVDQYQAAHPQSNLTTAAACRFAPGESLKVITYDSARGKLDILAGQPDGTYHSVEEVDVGMLSAKKILAGNFGGSSPVSLILCGMDKLLRIAVTEKTYSLKQRACFEPDIKGGRFGALTVGDINSDGCPDIILCEQARHHVEILTFDTKGELVSGYKFKVFEEPRAQEENVFQEGRQQGGGEPRAVTIGDVTGDGKNDLILLVHDRIIIYPQD